MARITIEDCIEQVPNRFHLVRMTAIRAKQLKKGANALVHSEENKEVVVALREIAAGLVAPDFSNLGAGESDEILSTLTDEVAGEGNASDVEPVAEGAQTPGDQ
jgi:DNA-directed RNA polymerase subunit omega